jgi:enoyl-CoA hydratase/carnithine racemase
VALLSIPGFSGLDPLIGVLSEELNEVCRAIAFDEGIRVLVLTTAVKQDVLPPVKDTAASVPDASSVSLRVTESIAALGFPTIAAVSGDAIGFGLELAMACDVRIASQSSRFGLPQILDGQIPCHGGTQRLPRLVGRAKAAEMILLGELISAEEASRTALVNRLAPVGDVEAAALEIAQDMATKGPVALRHAKEAIHKGLDMTIEQGLRLEIDLYFLLHSTKDRVEGIEAFKEKRKPEFHGE